MNSTATNHNLEELMYTQPVFGRLARYLVVKMMSKLKYGRIVLTDGTEKYIFGEKGDLCAHITVKHPDFYQKILFGGSIGAGEAYIKKILDVDDLTALVRIMVLNMELLDKMERGLAWALYPLRKLSHLTKENSKKGARKNILAHYDLGNDMYQSFLDPSMMYSSAIYPNKESSLEEASLNKLEIICEKLKLKATDRVIEIGSGWGGFAIYAAQQYGCHITTTTISNAQYEEAQRRITAAGLEDKITILLKDYRDLSGQYDKLVSIEMIEAVGDKYMPQFFKKCGQLLKVDGKMLVQAITIKDQKYKQYLQGVDFIQRYIFPGGCVPSNKRMVDLISTQTDMVVRQLEDFGFDYARTLRDWRKRFNTTFSSLQKKGYDESFKRLWEFYLCYCEGGFWERSISVVHLVADRPANRDAGAVL